MRCKSRRRPRSTSLMDFFVAAMGLALARAEVIHGRDGIHRVEKVRAVVTAAAVLEKGLEKRSQTTACPASHSACPDSLNGGCCQDGYECGTSSCFATTSAPQTCAGQVGYYPCAATVGGGCCPVGLICERANKCNPASGTSLECPENFFLCPETLGFGCCANGMGCGKDQCFQKAPSTYTYTRTTTSDDVTITTTITTTSTPVTPGAGAELMSTAYKIYPTAINKTMPIPSNGGDGGGLKKSQLGGIVGGAVAILVIIIVAAFFVIRQLRKVDRNRAAKEAGGPSSRGSRSRPNMKQVNQPNSSDTDAASVVVPFLHHSRNSSQQTAESDAESPAPYHDAALKNPAPNHGYQSVATGQERGHQNGVDSSQTDRFNSAASQRSIPRRPIEQSTPAGRRTSADSHRTNATSSRQRSNTNETSTSDVPSTVLELEASTVFVELPVNPPADPSRPPLIHQRNRSGGSTHSRNDSLAGLGTPQLDVVSELAETQWYHGGYYGPATHAGQTGADYPVPKSP